MKMTDSSVSVFARVRPLTDSETKAGIVELPGLQLESSELDSVSVNVMEVENVKIGGFTGTLGQTASNRDVFERCFAPHIGTVLQGGAASLFCYGYTGSGKTHTVIGYGEEKGLYYLAAERLLQDLHNLDNGLFLRATAYELYNDEVFDLIGPSKLPCTLRVDESGALQVLGPQESVPLDASESGILKSILPDEIRAKDLHATMVTRAASLRSVVVSQPENLDAISHSCIGQRAVGSSTEHMQSSRSHAMLRLEVVNSEIIEAQAALDAAKALIPARKNAMDNISLSMYKLLCDGNVRVLRKPVHGSQSPVMYVSPEDYVIAEEKAALQNHKYTERDMIVLEGHQGEGAKSIHEWAVHFGVERLTVQYAAKKREFQETGKWESIQEALLHAKTRLTKLYDDAQAEVEKAAQRLLDIQNKGAACLGGYVLLVDLAGADYDHRSGHAQKESAAINKSLLSLKECFRALSQASNVKPKFRDSKLTRILEDSLLPGTTSSRRNKDSISVMLVNVSPAEHLAKMTLNSLRYGQMFANASIATGSSTTNSSRAGHSKQRKPMPTQNDTNLMKSDPRLVEELWKFYREHCPEKTDQEVETIIQRFSGRESELLQKAREKYIGGA